MHYCKLFHAKELIFKGIYNTDILLCTSSKNLLGISLQARVAIKTWKTAFFTPKRMIKTWKSVVLFSYIFNDDSNTPNSNTPKTELP